jgi:hypothetical protein
VPTPTGGISKRCRCRDENGKDLGAKCPKLKQRNHGSWQIRHELLPAANGTRRTFRRSGIEDRDDAVEVYDRLRALLNLADDDPEDLEKITQMLADLGRKQTLPDPEVIRTELRSGQALNDNGTVGEWLDVGIEQRRHHHRRNKIATSTFTGYEKDVRLYLKPKIGHIRKHRLNVAHLIEMFNKIEDDNDKIATNNADRQANLTRVKEIHHNPSGSRKREWRRLKAERDAMPPFRRPVGPSSQHAILRTLRASLNDAIDQQLLTFNPAKHYEMNLTKPKPIIWTNERVAHWRGTGQRPGPVMVWTPAHVGAFFAYIAEHDPDHESMWHLFLKRGPRRGEIAGLPWTETQLDTATLEITTQLTEIYDYEEKRPKTEAGVRVIPLDGETVALLRLHRKRQEARRLELGDDWIDSGKVFTRADGSPLRPSWISQRFAALSAAAGLPPIRLHDTRHTAATSMLAAGANMKVVQETLGHATLSTTSGTYTSVLPEVSRAAADAVATLYRAGRPQHLGHPPGTHGNPVERMQAGGDHPSKEKPQVDGGLSEV